MATYGHLLPTRGILLHSEDGDELTRTVQAQVVPMAQRAEAAGFESVWVGDSVLAKPRLEALTTIAAVAGATETLELGTAVYLPTLRHVVHVAQQVATLSQLSAGRLTLGVGIGIGADSAVEHRNLDVPYEGRASRLDESLDLLAALWEGEPVTHEGRHYTLEEADIGFGPAETPRIYPASAAFDPTGGFPWSVERRLVTHGDGWLPVGISPEGYRAGLEHLESALSEAGRDPTAFDRACYIDVVVAETEAEAIEAGRAFLKRYYPPEFIEQFHDGLPDDRVRARGAFGPPSLVASRLEAYERAGVERFVVRFLARDQLDQQRRFAEVVT